MKNFLVLNIVLAATLNLWGQTYFSFTPDIGGDNMVGEALNVIPLEGEIKVLGQVSKAHVPGFEGGTWPVMVSISYNGEYLGTSYLVDSAYADPFRYFTRRISFRNDSVCYLYDRRDIGNVLLDAYLIELNYLQGTILRSQILENYITGSENFSPKASGLGRNGNIYLLNTNTDVSLFEQFITVLDSGFNLLSQSMFENFGRKNTPNFIEVDSSDRNITIVGMSRGEPTSVWWESKLYRQVLDSNFVTVDFNLAPSKFDQSIILADFYPIIRGQNHIWVVASQRVVETPDCHNCSISIPYIVGISDDFSKVLWETRMFEGDTSSSIPSYDASSITQVGDGYIFAGAMNAGAGATSGILGKVSLSGDSLWLKHYIPVGWDSSRGLWFDLKDIKTTPLGNIVACGRSFDLYQQIRVPWILHLDPDGCLEPGCNTTAITNPSRDQGNDIQVFPNPASTHCSIRVVNNKVSSFYKLRITDMRGALIRQLDVPGRDVNFMLDLTGWPPGTYIAQLVNGQEVQLTKQFVVVK